jgi:hypothetical protein
LTIFFITVTIKNTMKQKFISSLLLIIMLVPLMFFVAPGANAQTFMKNVRSLDKANARAQERVEVKEQMMLATPQAKMQEACEARVNAVENRMNSLIKLVENMLRVFDAHSTRVQEYYLNTVVAAGLTVENYDELLANIAAKKAVVQTTLVNVQADADEFNCELGDPKTYIDDFRADMLMVKSALQDYRESIKNLIVAVRTVATTLPSVTPTPSPTL